MWIDYETAGGIARLTLNRPEKRNALNASLIAELISATARADADPDVRVILLRGAGKDFCAGMDLADLTAEGPTQHLEDAQRIADLYLALRKNTKPVIAAVHGRALGGGCGLANACDLTVASESASFCYSEINIGFVPAIVAVLLRRSVGEKRSFDLLTSGIAFRSSEAQALGLVNRVFSDEEFETLALEYAAQIASKSTTAIALTKRLLYQVDGMSFETAVQSGIFVNALARGTEDARRGIEQFITKHK